MDTTKAITHVSLCAGYGGIDLGLRRAIPALRTIAVSEIEAFACANLVAKMEAGLLDPAPIWTDLKTFPWAEFRDRVDILSGGYPCQPFSAAGKRLGAEDPRHLWPHISAGIALMRPAVCFFENVEGHISLGLPDVIEDLAGLGYRTTWCVASASECGAPHQRKRVFILAYRHGERGQLPDWWRVTAEQVPVGHGETWRDDTMANAASAGYSADAASICGSEGEARRQDVFEFEHCGATPWPSRPGEQQFAWEPPRVVVDAKSQRAGQRSELRSEECGSGSALSWELNQPSEGAVADTGSITRRKAERQLQPDIVEECGRNTEAAESCTSGNQGIVANDHSPHAGHGEQRPERTLGDLSGGCGEAGAMGHPNSPRPQERPRQRGSAIQGADADGGEAAERQTQPPLGRDADGPADWLDHTELYTTCDNRTDELRLLGNGVVPATAERAFRVLVGELMEDAQ